MPTARPNRPLLLSLAPIALVPPLFLNSIGGGRFWLHLLIIFFVWGIVAQSWNLIMAVAGIYSFGQIALYAVGGWMTGVLAQHHGVNPCLSLWLATDSGPGPAILAG